MEIQKIEKKILKFWEENKTFEKSIENRQKAEDFVFYEGPPTANGRPGIHHVLARVFKDLICRYKTMQGYRVTRKAGWDTHGLPVELEVEKELGLKNKQDIEKFGITKFNNRCRESVWKYKKEWEDLTEKIGFWLDMDDPYITYEKGYMETLWWIIKRVWEKDLLYQDYKVVPYCPRCGTGLSSHEVALGYKKIEEPSIFLKFKVSSFAPASPRLRRASKASEDKQNSNLKTYLLVWTTTPWTLPGNVAIAVHPDIDYVFVKHRDEGLILAKARLNSLDGEYEILEEFKGEDLVGLEYEGLFDFIKPEGRIWTVIPGGFVQIEEGTGLVHIAPAFGEEDLDVVKSTNSKISASAKASADKQNSKDKIPVLMTVKEDGTFTDEVKPWAGRFVKDADPEIIKDLDSRGILYKEITYEHDYPFCWRCDSPLLYYAKKSWFIGMSKIKDKLIENNQNINWVPGHLKEGRFGEWLRELKDWAFSRERYWGTPLPIWQCQMGKNQKPKTSAKGGSASGGKNQKPCDNVVVIGSFEDLSKQKFTTNEYYILRHGGAESNVGNFVSSFPEKKPVSLTPEGKKSIEEVADSLKDKHIDLIFASPLKRTLDTANIIAKKLGLEVSTDDRLREIDTGIFNGEHIDKYRGFFEDHLSKFEKRPVDGENVEDVRKRMLDFVKTIDKKYKNKKILIVSHGDPLWMLEASLKGLDRQEAIDFVKTSGMKTGELRKVDFASFPYNEKGHLDLHRPHIDEIEFICSKCGGRMERVKELIDVWFDSGAMPFSQNPKGFWEKSQIPNPKSQIGEEEFLFPADYICEAMDQTRGWFYTLLAVSTLLDAGVPYKNVISVGLVLDKNGEKMSKSKGNIVDPWEIVEKYGADPLRWYFYTVNQPGETKRFNEEDVADRLKRFVGTFYNTYIFFETYVSKKQIRNPKSEIRNNILDQWIISRSNELIQSVTESLDHYDITSAARVIEDFVNDDLSNWYVRRSRKRFQHPESPEEKQEAQNTLQEVLLTLSKLSAPFIPFLSEEIYTRIKKLQETRIKNNKLLGSVHLEDWSIAEEKLIDKELNEKMDTIRQIVGLGLKLRAKSGIKVRQPLGVFEIKRSKKYELRILSDLIKEELNVKEVKFVEKVNKNFVVEKEGGLEIALDTKITPQLREEGAVREIVRQIQEMRKHAGYKPKDLAMVNFSTTPDFDKLLARWEDHIKNKTILQELISGKESKKVFDVEKEMEIDYQKIWLGIKKA